MAREISLAFLALLNCLGCRQEGFREMKFDFSPKTRRKYTKAGK